MKRFKMHRTLIPVSAAALILLTLASCEMKTDAFGRHYAVLSQTPSNEEEEDDQLPRVGWKHKYPLPSGASGIDGWYDGNLSGFRPSIGNISCGSFSGGGISCSAP